MRNRLFYTPGTVLTGEVPESYQNIAHILW